MLRVGLTGGIGSGKSAVAALLRELGVPVLDTDDVARWLVEPGQPALAEIAARFGDAILTADGRLDRPALRNLVFADADGRRQLEAILHPRIRRYAIDWLAGQQAAYAVLVVPLLFETGMDADVDRVWVVDVPTDVQIARVGQRDAASAEQVQRILAAQAGRAERLAQADAVLDNSGDFDQLRLAVCELDRRYRAGC